GVLAHLEMLEFQAHREAVEQEEKEKRKEKSAFLRAKIRELRLQRDQLREKLELLEKAQPGKEGIPADPALPSPREVLEWKIRNLRELLQVFQLTGISGKLSKHGICFCLRTAFEGSFLDSFHLELLPRPESREFRIQRHSIPPFIPLEQLSRKFLPSDLRGFLDVLFQHLNAFVGRRHQLEQFQEQFSEWIQGIPHCNSLCNLLSFQYRIPGKSGNSVFQTRLLYGDPCRSLPTDVAGSCSADPSPAFPEHSELFRRLALPRAFRAL
ncbi:CENPO protein, partial [Daphoenositta chrysoptera]|nr:CENPO protein [Daphoenositta chrysoptera]